MKDKNKKGGLGRGRPPPYLVGAVPLWCGDVLGIDLLASPSNGVTCRGHALTCTSLCREGGRRVRLDFHSEEVRWHSCCHPRCCGGMDVIVVE
jgi:hypothetical protein